ncbi:MAG: tyrosine-type recombinase/integrase [Flavobacteriales bacterium]|jgi:integrase/recombinase XerC|nr:tyrosine-type recombinase/integrase [Flavobacteriales bacterium]
MDELKLFYNYLKNERRFSVHTLTAYEKDLNQYIAYLQEFDVAVIDAETSRVRSWLVVLLEMGIAERSVNRKLSAVKSFYRYLIQQGRVEVSPVQDIKVLKTAKKTPAFVRATEMDRLLKDDVFEKNFKGGRDKVILYLLYYTGMRLSELIHIKEADVGVDTVKVIGKRNKERYIPISDKLLKLIKEYVVLKKEAGFFSGSSSFLLVTDKGDKLYEKFVFRKVKYYLSLVTTQKDRSPHVLRHTFATQMLNAGADLNAIKEILGHADLSATQVYTHNSIEKLKGIYKQAHPRSGD